LNKVVSFEIVFCDLGITPTVTLFWVFQSLCKQGDWFSVAKRGNTKDVYMDEGPSSMKKWKNKFFFIDRKAIPDYLTWRNFHSYVFDDLPIDGYDRNDVAQLCTHLTRLHEINEAVLVRSGLSYVWFNENCDLVFRRKDDNSEMSIYDFMTLLTWENAEWNATAPLVGPSEPDQPRRKIRLRKRASEAGSSTPVVKRAEDVEGTDILDFCTQLEDSFNRLGSPLTCLSHAASSGPSHVGTSNAARASSSGHGVIQKARAEVMHHQLDPLGTLDQSALAHYQEYDDSPEDDFAAASLGEEIDLTLFPLASSPYVMPYPFFDDLDACRKVFDRTITPAELRRTKSLLPLQLSNQMSVLTALLASHGIEMNSRYITLVASKARLPEKRKRKENRELRSLSDTSSEEFKNLMVQLAEAKATTARSSDELARTDAKLSDQALVVGNLKNELALPPWWRGGYAWGVPMLSSKRLLKKFSLGAEAEFNRAVATLPSTNFLFLSKIGCYIVEEAEGALSEVVNIQPNKIVCLTLFPPAPTTSYPAGESFGWTSTPKGFEATYLALDFLPP
ncbi:hypothetical protein Tco_0701853, partial [Tanacetum coccineum]